ncbi:hypothetical protein PFISCL1PPCAC_18455, partial [Pristionchus fissidentatus]
FQILFIACAIGSELVDKNVCALKCAGITDPSPPVFQTGCSRVLYNGKVTDKNDKWSYNREVYEGLECGVYTHVISTERKVYASVAPIGNNEKCEIQEPVELEREMGNCIRGCGVELRCANAMTITNSTCTVGTTSSGVAVRGLNHVQFACGEQTTHIIRVFRDETYIRIDLEKDTEKNREYSEIWSVARGQLSTEHLLRSISA